MPRRSFARLGLGSVLGYLVAGAVVGPSVFGLTGEATDVMSFAEFGVIVMLFLVGLELQPEKLWDLRKRDPRAAVACRSC